MKVIALMLFTLVAGCCGTPLGGPISHTDASVDGQAADPMTHVDMLGADLSEEGDLACKCNGSCDVECAGLYSKCVVGPTTDCGPCAVEGKQCHFTVGSVSCFQGKWTLNDDTSCAN